jgi:hypothetical protein
MTAKEQLKQTVEKLSEAEAQDALGFIVRRQNKRDALAELLDSAPDDDEPTTPEEDEVPVKPPSRSPVEKCSQRMRSGAKWLEQQVTDAVLPARSRARQAS